MHVTANMKIQNRIIHSFLAATLLSTFLQFFPTITLADSSTGSERLSAEEQARLYPETMRYTIRRKGKTVGEHTITFQQDANGLSVNVESKITVTVLKVPVFRFNYTANEYWQSGNLVSVNARTNRGGETTRASYIPDSTSQTSNHWNPEVLDTDTVFNTITGNISKVNIEPIAEVTLTAGDQSISASHYRYTGDIQADVWYDDKNRWVKLQFKGDDGSTISYIANPLVINP